MKPLVLLHGFTGSAASFDLVLAALDEVPAVLCPPLLGHDGTSGPSSVVTFEDEIDRLAAVVAEWTDEPAYLVGYSLGARVALALLADHPDRFAGAVLIGVNPGLEERGERATRMAADDRWRAMLDRGDLEGFIAAWSDQTLFETQRNLPPEVRDQQQRERLAHAAGGLSRSLGLMGLGSMPSHWSTLPAILHPIELMVGEKDTKFLPIAQELGVALPDARLYVVPDAGHNLLLEAPAAVALIVSKGIAA